MSNPSVPNTALAALDGRADLEPFGRNALLLYALELRYGLDDLRTVADDSLTDGTNDRKCDLVYVDRENSQAVIAQSYVADDPSKPNPPANKAADLNTALTWALGNAPSDQLGEKLQAAAAELRDALESGDISVIEIWFVHNLPNSADVDSELRQVEETAKALVSRHFSGLEGVEVRTLQVGRDRLDNWYRSTSSAILVSAQIEVPEGVGYFLEGGDGWEAVCCSVPAAWLAELYERYGDELFSANVRGPIPSRRSRSNINFAIEQTAKDAPRRFWAYNNGVTAIVNDFRLPDGDSGPIQVSGIAIVNGAQTTGALGRAKNGLDHVSVLARFVKSSERTVIDDIIRFNNSQNPIKASDFRSRDLHQDRLRDEFRAIPDAMYLGARRGGQTDAARKPSNYLSSDTAAQALAAFHGDPARAYNELRQIWERDDYYAQYFSDHTSAQHIVFCFSLVRAIQDWKERLTAEADDLPTTERNVLSFLRKRGSTWLLAAAIASCLDTVLGRAVPSTFRLSFGQRVSPADAVEAWRPLVEALGAFGGQLDVADSGTTLKRSERPSVRLEAFQQAVAAVRVPLRDTFDAFAGNVEELTT